MLTNLLKKKPLLENKNFWEWELDQGVVICIFGLCFASGIKINQEKTASMRQ